MTEVISTSTHVEDLSDGRMLAPGEVTKGVDTNHPHNQRLIADGKLAVVEHPKSEEQLKKEKEAKEKAEKEQAERERAATTISGGGS